MVSIFVSSEAMLVLVWHCRRSQELNGGGERGGSQYVTTARASPTPSDTDSWLPVYELAMTAWAPAARICVSLQDVLAHFSDSQPVVQDGDGQVPPTLVWTSEWQRTAAETNSRAKEPQNSTPMCSQLMSFILAPSLPLPLPSHYPTWRRCLPRPYRITL
jgi:hypothetical protein